jgi:BioD-like phosphotransacetylase family protein
MANLYVTSAETFSGKSALCIGLGMRFAADGLKVGYIKPVNVTGGGGNGRVVDEDVLFARQVLDLPEAVDVIGPVSLSQTKLQQQLNGPEVDYEPKLRQALAIMSAGRDVVVLEGGRSLREGYVAGLPPRHVVEMAHARVLLVLRYDEALMVDRALTAQDYFGNRLIGTVINQVPPAAIKDLYETVVRYLTRHDIYPLAVLPKDPLLLAPTVAELAEGVDADILCCAERQEAPVEHMLVGAMSVEQARSYFRGKANKVVITGGDRVDIQLAALETSTRCLILTGNLYPSPAVLRRAEELGVPVLLVKTDTLSCIEVVEKYFGRSRFQQPHKVSHFNDLLNEHFDFATLYESLDLAPKVAAKVTEIERLPA